LFPARDPEALAKKVSSLMIQTELASRIAQNGMHLVRSTYNWQQFGRRVSEVAAALLPAAIAAE
jgi:hypothetical protein